MAKIAVPAGAIGYGWLTLNNFALVVGALASIAVAVHTVLKIYWDAKDRRAGQRKGAA